MLRLFLSLKGRISRQKFWIALPVFALFVWASQWGLDKIAHRMEGFFLSLIFIVLFFIMLYAIYGKRLHDFGRTVWPITGMIFGTVFVTIIVMLAYGGAEYFTEFSQYDRKEDIDPAEIKRLQDAYQARIAEGGKLLGPLLWGLWGLFTLWVGLRKSDETANSFDDPTA